jgi:hypothetical protein
MASIMARYYDRFGFRNSEQASASTRNYGKAVLRRGKVRYAAPVPDVLDLPQPIAMAAVGVISRARRDPVIVIPIAKTKPILSSY